VLDHAGVIAGMSGSPVYFEGKFAGAVAYAWRFSKDPIAGITPAEYMLEYLNAPELPKKAKAAAAKLTQPLKAALSGTVEAQAEKTGGFWNQFSGDAASELAPVVTPLSGSLLQGRAMTLIEKELGRFFMMPAQAGSIPVQVGLWKAAKKGDKKEAKGQPLRTGGPVAVQLVRGDVDLSGSGTVTAVQGNKALAFGHPMFNFGQIEVPATAAYVHHCLASLSFSFKMSQPEEEAGALVLDRQAGIMVDMSRKAHVVPLTLHLEDQSRGLEENWSMEVLHHKMLTPSLVRTAVTAAVDKFSPDIEEAVVKAVYTVDIHKHKSLVLEEKVFQDKGTLSLAYSQRLSTALDALISSDFEKVRIDAVHADISIHYTYGVANISGAYLSVEEAEPGDRVDLYVYVKPPRESEQIYTTSFEVPTSAAGKTLEVEIRSGSDAVPDTVMPQDVDDVIDNLSKSYPSDSIVVEIEVPAQGISIGGKVMKNLPASALDTLSPKAAYLGEQPEAVLDRHFIYPGMLMEGSVKLKLNVKGQDDK
jgi:hypothetical protein